MISLVVPTFKRPDFAIRTLHYYASAGFPGEILMGDSSDGEAAERTRRFAEKVGGKLRVRYVDCRGIDDRLTLHRLSQMVATKYAAFIGDDDVILASGIGPCVRFLESNGDFVAANGTSLVFELSREGAYGKPVFTDAYPQPDLPQERPLQRLEAHLRDYRVSLFSVHRAEVWREMWRQVPEIEDRAFSAELLPCCVSPVLGKIKHLGHPYLLRQSHTQRYDLPRFSDWLSSPKWRRSHAQFCEFIGARLAESERLDPGAASETVQRLLADHYIRRFTVDAPQTPTPEPDRGVLADLRAGLARRKQSRQLLRGWSDASEPFASDLAVVQRVLAAPPTGFA